MFILCALCEKKQLKELMDQKKKDVLFSSIFFVCFGYKIISIHVLII